jgi:protein SCO1/2
VSAGGAFRGGVLEPAHLAPDFTLTASDGSTFRLREQRGRVVVLFFGYTFCPDVCPLTLSEMVQVRAKLGDRAERVRVVFVTVDPERDTRDRLRRYVGTFHPSFLGLTGDPEALAGIRRAYGVVAEKRVVAGTRAASPSDHSASCTSSIPRAGSGCCCRSGRRSTTSRTISSACSEDRHMLPGSPRVAGPLAALFVAVWGGLAASQAPPAGASSFT